MRQSRSVRPVRVEPRGSIALLRRPEIGAMLSSSVRPIIVGFKAMSRPRWRLRSHSLPHSLSPKRCNSVDALTPGFAENNAALSADHSGVSWPALLGWRTRKRISEQRRRRLKLSAFDAALKRCKSALFDPKIAIAQLCNLYQSVIR
jgi:hypothetical protein